MSNAEIQAPGVWLCAMASKAMSSEEAGPFKAAEDYAMGWYLKQPDRIGNASPEPTFHILIKQFGKIWTISPKFCEK